MGAWGWRRASVRPSVCVLGEPWWPFKCCVLYIFLAYLVSYRRRFGSGAVSLFNTRDVNPTPLTPFVC